MRVASIDGMLQIALLALVATWIGSLARLALPRRHPVAVRAGRRTR